MADLFISYSRKDIAYARLLHNALSEHDLQAWIDWQDIPPSTEWIQEVYTAIEEADSFIFILSDASAISETCNLEIEHARKNNKRIIPIVINEVSPTKIHPALAAVNWIFSRSKDELQPAIESLIEAIRTDYEWVKMHTRLQVRALEWERANMDRSFLLQGTDLRQAEEWLAKAPEKKPEPTLLQSRFIQSSRQEASKRQRRLLIGVGAALVVTVVLGVVAWINGQQAEKNARLARIRELTAVSQLSGTRFDIAMLLGLESYNTIQNYQTLSNLFRLTQRNPKVIRTMNHVGVSKIAYSPDGKYIASAGKGVYLWNVADRQSPVLIDDSNEISDIVFSPDGKTLVYAHGEGQIFFWEVASGLLLRKSPSNPAWKGVTCLSYSPDGTLLAVGSHDRHVYVLDVSSMQPISEPLEGYYSRGWSDNIPFSPNGSIVAYPSGENNAATEIRLWDVLDKQPLGNPLSGYNLQYTNTFALDFSPVENLLASASEDQIILWNIADMQPFTIIDHVVNAVSISFSPDGKSLASSSGNSSIILWDVTSGQSKGEPLSAHKGFVSDIEFSPDGSRLASCSREDDMIILWDVSESVTNNEELGWLDEFGTDNLAFSPDRQTLAIGRHGGETDLFNIASQQLVGRLLPGNNGRVSSLAYSPDGQTLATAGKDGDILLWNLDTMQPIGNTLKTGSPTSQQEVAFSPDGKILASSNQDIADSMVLLWDLTASQPESTLLQRNIHFVNCLAFSPDGKILAAGAEGYTLLWDLTSREKIGELWGQDGWIDSLAFSPDGSILATGSDADMIVLWDMASQEPIGDRLWEHKTPISDLAFSPDGTFLASASLDGAIYLWDVASGQPLGESITRADGKDVPVVIAFSADGKTLIMLTQDGILSYLDMNAASWHESLCQRVGRNFTQAEWVSYFPGEPYRKTCEQWPGGE